MALDPSYAADLARKLSDRMVDLRQIERLRAGT
jgi:hypothetical protein